MGHHSRIRFDDGIYHKLSHVLTFCTLRLLRLMVMLLNVLVNCFTSSVFPVKQCQCIGC